MIAARRPHASDRSTPTPTRRPARRLAVTCASTLVALGLLAARGPATAWAWGAFGHRIAGQIAFDRLTPNARKAVADLLDPGQSLADASVWADQVRDTHPEASTWHYVNVPITESKYDRKYEDPKGGVVSKIGHFQGVLRDPAAPRPQRQEALKFLAHFVEDMHQPVHVGHRDDRGGNNLQVQFFEKGSNLHRVWDSNLLEHGKRSQAEYVKALEARITPELAAEWSQGTIEDWANESLNHAKAAYTAPGEANQLRSGAKLGQAYYEANLPVAELRVEQAGVRLAKVLNDIFP